MKPRVLPATGFFYCSLGKVIFYGNSNAVYVRARFVSQRIELFGNRIPFFLTVFFFGKLKLIIQFLA